MTSYSKPSIVASYVDNDYVVSNYEYVVRIEVTNGPIQGKYEDIIFNTEEEALKFKAEAILDENYVGYFKKAIIK